MSNSLATYVKHTGFIALAPLAKLLMCAADCETKGYEDDEDEDEDEDEEVDEVANVLAALLTVLLPGSFRLVPLLLLSFALTELCI